MKKLQASFLFLSVFILVSVTLIFFFDFSLALSWRESISERMLSLCPGLSSEVLKIPCESLPSFLRGMSVTVMLTLGLLLVGFVLAVPVALGQLYGPAPVRWLMSAYERFFRATPILVLLLFFAFGLKINLPAFLSAVIVFGLHSSAYQSQIFRGTIQSISVGQIAAARALGMSRFQAICHIVLPQAFRLAIPAWSNEYSSVLKDTAFAFTVGLVELNQTGVQVANYSRQFFVIFFAIAIIYLILTLVGTRLLESLEKRVRIPGLTVHQGAAHGHG
jgi:polar amino acid transport system permease protein